MVCGINLTVEMVMEQIKQTSDSQAETQSIDYAYENRFLECFLEARQNKQQILNLWRICFKVNNDHNKK